MVVCLHTLTWFQPHGLLFLTVDGVHTAGSWLLLAFATPVGPAAFHLGDAHLCNGAGDMVAATASVSVPKTAGWWCSASSSYASDLQWGSL